MACLKADDYIYGGGRMNLVVGIESGGGDGMNLVVCYPWWLLWILMMEIVDLVVGVVMVEMEKESNDMEYIYTGSDSLFMWRWHSNDVEVSVKHLPCEWLYKS